MSIETWGMMDKSQDDAEKVEEAIDRLILAHEADPQAHLGAGESLETHRQEDILDHPAGSVMPDKVGANVGIDGKTVLTNYELTVEQGTSGGFGYGAWSTNLSAQTDYEAYLSIYFSNVYLTYDDFLDLSFYLYFPGSGIADGTWTLMLDSDLGDNMGFRIRKSGTDTYLDAMEGGGSPIASVILTAAAFGQRRMRFVYDVVEQKAYAYMNGVLMMTVTGADLVDEIGRFKPSFVVQTMSRTTNTALGFSITGWTASYGLPNL